jgi:hypothetical protein
MPNGSVARRKEGITTMANNATPCVKKATIDQQAQKAIDAIDPVLANPNAPATDLRKALDLAKTTLKTLRSDPHRL